jgi:inner membrane protein
MNEGKEVYIRKQLHILPDQLEIKGNVVPEEKKRGIYEMVVYRAGLNISGHFQVPASINEQIAELEIINNTLSLCLGISDLRGIKGVSIRIDGKVMEEMPGLPFRDVASKGIHVPISPDLLSRSKIPFEIDLQLYGSSELSFIPVGKNTEVEISSSWASPSFDGAFLPVPPKHRQETMVSVPAGR